MKAVFAITLMISEISAICGYISINFSGPNKPFIVSILLIPMSKPAVTIAGNIGMKMSPNNLIKRCNGLPFCAAAFFSHFLMMLQRLFLQ